MKENKETQKSFVDPELRLMKTNIGGFEVCYNVQTAVDAGNHMIVDFEVTNNCNDLGLLFLSYLLTLILLHCYLLSLQPETCCHL